MKGDVLFLMRTKQMIQEKETEYFPCAHLV